MPLQNRVTPAGEIIATPHRGMFTGNRGIIHDPATRTLLARRWANKAWLTCVCEFKGRRREVMGGRSWTELFFLDEATAFAAGHRPCFECRRKDYNRFKSFWLQGNPEYGFSKKTSIQEIDQVLHRERLKPDADKSGFMANLEDLPDGVFIEFEGQPWLLADKLLYQWTPFGYDKKISLPSSELTVLTPR